MYRAKPQIHGSATSDACTRGKRAVIARRHHGRPVGLPWFALTVVVLGTACGSVTELPGSNSGGTGADTATGGQSSGGGGTGTAEGEAACKQACDQFLGGTCHGGCVAACSANNCGLLFSAADFEGILGLVCGGDALNFIRSPGRGALACTVASGTGKLDGTKGTQKRMFVTKATFTGDLRSEGNAGDGLEGGDKLCQAAADGASAGGTWKAWLSSSTTDAIARIADVSPWLDMNRNGFLFPTKVSLTSGPDLSSLPVNATDEYGNTPAPMVWTGTITAGTKAMATCQDWTSGVDFVGEVGGTWSGSWTWTDASFKPCTSLAALYCFEQ